MKDKKNMNKDVQLNLYNSNKLDLILSNIIDKLGYKEIFKDGYMNSINIDNKQDIFFINADEIYLEKLLNYLYCNIKILYLKYINNNVKKFYRFFTLLLRNIDIKNIDNDTILGTLGYIKILYLDNRIFNNSYSFKKDLEQLITNKLFTIFKHIKNIFFKYIDKIHITTY